MTAAGDIQTGEANSTFLPISQEFSVFVLPSQASPAELKSHHLFSHIIIELIEGTTCNQSLNRRMTRRDRLGGAPLLVVLDCAVLLLTTIVESLPR